MLGRHGRGQDGYVLLALLASSAVLLVGLALSIPQMAMQSQRIKDQRLVDRGEDFRRAVELYYRDHQKYPEEVDDLEETDNVRYLRGVSKDPMGETGEWRLIHMGTDGRFEDSLLYDTKEQREREMEQREREMRGGAGSTMVGQSFPQAGMAGVSSQKRLATSQGRGLAPDQFVPEAAQPGYPFTEDAGEPVLPGRQSAAPDLAESVRYSQGFQFSASEPSEASEDDSLEGDPEVDGAQDVKGQTADERAVGEANTTGVAATGGTGSFPVNQPGSLLRSDQFNQPGSLLQSNMRRSTGIRGPGGSMQDPTAAVRGSGAAEMVNRLLTTPRQGGLAGTSPLGGQQVQAQVFKRGIAGVASKSTKRGVLVYHEKESYNEWEFVFDYRSAQEAAQRQGQAMGPGRQGGALPRSQGRTTRTMRAPR